MSIFITQVSLSLKKSDDDVTFVGICTKLTCFLTSEEQDLSAGASLQHHSASLQCCFVTHLTFYPKFAPSAILAIALGRIAISIVVLFIPSYWNYVNCNQSALQRFYKSCARKLKHIN